MNLDRGTWLALIAMIVSIFLVANDFTAFSVAIANIESDLDTTLSRAQWVVNAYTVVFGVLIVTGGRLADLLGRKRIFLVGAAIFASFSLLGGLSQSIDVLIASRAAMAVGGAFMWPAVLSLVYALLPRSKASLAGAIIMSVVGVGNAFGPLLGGFWTDVLSWRWIFFANVPIALLAILLVWLYVKESEVSEGKPHIDYKGITALSISVVLLLIGLDQSTQLGLTDPWILASFATSIVAFIAFVFIERREGETALVPESIMKNKQFMYAAAAVLPISAIFFGALIYLPLFTQSTFGWSAIGAGAGLLPMMGTFAITSATAGWLYDKLGGKAVLTLGALCLTAGIFILSFLSSGTEFIELVPGMIIAGAGVGLFYSAITTVGITAVKEKQSSLAGGIIYMCTVTGGSIGLGLNTAIVLSADTLPQGISDAFRVDFLLGLVSLGIVVILIRGTGLRDALHFTHHRAH